jgi:hypothetical protein
MKRGGEGIDARSWERCRGDVWVQGLSGHRERGLQCPLSVCLLKLLSRFLPLTFSLLFRRHLGIGVGMEEATTDVERVTMGAVPRGRLFHGKRVAELRYY